MFAQYLAKTSFGVQSKELTYSPAGKSTAISVSLRSDPPNLILKVKDNGSGRTSEAETREGFGFVNLRARVKKLKGSLDIRTALGRGTSIVVNVPVGVSG